MLVDLSRINVDKSVDAEIIVLLQRFSFRYRLEFFEYLFKFFVVTQVK